MQNITRKSKLCKYRPIYWLESKCWSTAPPPDVSIPEGNSGSHNICSLTNYNNKQQHVGTYILCPIMTLVLSCNGSRQSGGAGLSPGWHIPFREGWWIRCGRCGVCTPGSQKLYQKWYRWWCLPSTAPIWWIYSAHHQNHRADNICLLEQFDNTE